MIPVNVLVGQSKLITFDKSIERFSVSNPDIAEAVLVAGNQVVVNGKAGEPFALVGRAIFSPDGRRVTYAADEGEKQYVVIGEEKREVSGRLGDSVFSPDGRKVGYGARIGRELWWKVLEAP